MTNKSEDLQAVFSALTPRNREVLLLVARSMQIAQSPPDAACANPSPAKGALLGPAGSGEQHNL